MTFSIRGIGAALPSTTITQSEALALAKALCSRTVEQATWLPLMFKGTEVGRRNVVHPRALIRDVLEGTRASNSPYLPSGAPEDRGPSTATRMRIYAEEAEALALMASQRAFEASQISPRKITHLVTVSCTGFAAPGVDCALIDQLDLRRTVQRTHVGFMGCHGAVNGLRVASAFTGADSSAHVLMCAVELCSLHYHYGWDPQKVVANALFADGAAAIVGTSESLEGNAWQVRATGSCLIPKTADLMSWTIGDHGFEMTLSKRVPEVIKEHLRPWVTRWLDEQGLALSNVGSWAVHPGGPRILEAVQSALGLSDAIVAESRAVFAEHGNLSSPTVLLILQRLQSRGAARPCVLLGFGPGLVAEAALLT